MKYQLEVSAQTMEGSPIKCKGEEIETIPKYQSAEAHWSVAMNLLNGHNVEHSSIRIKYVKLTLLTRIGIFLQEHLDSVNPFT